MEQATSLARFLEAQKNVFETACAELEAGCKRTHWMWFVFPQLRGLGRSQTAHFYGIANPDEARAYLADPVLGARLRHCVRLLLRHRDKPIRAILGSPDDQKSRSRLTLFEAIADDPRDRALFAEALDVFHGGARDSRTLAMLEGERA
ncbi:MAG: hypothetical protein HLUCCO17_15960 [Saliniramus fredricksonii]|uniref:Uncharacterized protein, DUF1810 family n=1 Tax=Saliniramus fredricksonii TaxID=1653334 RepID=A0A0P7ZWJ1_9HYPH|nr:DUF1810 domain-containing protein [Saliniramus fredricksonii]KPQ09174.1 MAG: hypothetical protein HLUCCO17_15960 [Saliniramus fredricksonii]SCC80784.1 Uncharacterized protein, DUF1810 family [Saliniramus fredricksonii]